jgi:hypothetical protein
VYDRRQDVAGRVAEWCRVVAAHPKAAIPRLHLGLALEKANDPAGAEEAYRLALAANPNIEADAILFNTVKNGPQRNK